MDQSLAFSIAALIISITSVLMQWMHARMLAKLQRREDRYQALRRDGLTHEAAVEIVEREVR